MGRLGAPRFLLGLGALALATETCSLDYKLLEGQGADGGTEVNLGGRAAAGGSGGGAGRTLPSDGGTDRLHISGTGSGSGGVHDASPGERSETGGTSAASGGVSGSPDGGEAGASETGGAGARGTGGASGGTGGVHSPPGTGGGSAGTPGTGGVVPLGGRVGSGGISASGGVGATGSGGGTAGKSGTGGAPGGTGGSPPGTGGATGPAILSIDFVGGIVVTGTTLVIPAPAMDETETAGVKAAKYWNSAFGASGSLDTVNLSDGTSATVGVSWTCEATSMGVGVWRLNFTDSPGDVRMMNGYLDPTSNTLPAKVTVSNLPPAFSTRGYDVYVYFVGDIPDGATRSSKYAIGSTAATATQIGPTPTAFTGYKLAPANGSGNYVVFRGVTGSTFSLTATPNGGSPPRAPVNGLQIVSPPGT